MRIYIKGTRYDIEWVSKYSFSSGLLKLIDPYKREVHTQVFRFYKLRIFRVDKIDKGGELGSTG